MKQKIIQAILIHPKELEGPWGNIVQFVRFSIAGFISAVLEIGSLLYFVNIFHIHYLASNVVAFVIANLLNYYLSRKWVYGESKYMVGIELTAFFVSGAIGLLINQAVLFLLIDKFHTALFLGKIGAIIITIIWNYFTKRHIVFKTS